MKKFLFLLVLCQFYQPPLSATYEYTEEEIELLQKGINHYEKKLFKAPHMKKLEELEKDGHFENFLSKIINIMKGKENNSPSLPKSNIFS